MSEWLRRQIQDLLRKRMGSNPIPRKKFDASLQKVSGGGKVYFTPKPV